MSAPARPTAAATARLKTGGDCLRFANKLFKSAGIAHGQGFVSAEEESLTLMGHATGLSWEELPQCFTRPLTAREKQTFLDLVEKRVFDRTPTGYLVGETWLGGLRFRVDPRVIIPRSYFVELIPEAIPQWLPPAGQVTRVADVCTGSGCLAILLAKRFPKAVVEATDLSADALEVARLNVADHRLAKRVRLHRTDVMTALVGGQEFDLILSNPPYEPEGIYRRLPAEFKKEPKQSLVSGRDGLDVIRKLLAQARGLLKPHGVLVIEVGGLRDAMHRAWPTLPMLWLATTDGSDCVCLIHAADLRRLPAASPRARRGR
jgi:ribosomal protein L3 glutamine methyltransferase